MEEMWVAGDTDSTWTTRNDAFPEAGGQKAVFDYDRSAGVY